MRTGPAACFVPLLWAAFALAEDRPLFERDIAPILTSHCWSCHGAEDLKAGLDLRTPALIARGSSKGAVVIPGSSDRSPLYVQVSTGAMPPGKELKLSKAEIDTVARWIDSGAQAAR